MSRSGNTKCLQCENMFHTCPSCGLVGAEWDYCSLKCYETAGSPTHDRDGEEYDGLPFVGSLINGKLLKSMPLNVRKKPDTNE